CYTKYSNIKTICTDWYERIETLTQDWYPNIKTLCTDWKEKLKSIFVDYWDTLISFLKNPFEYLRAIVFPLLGEMISALAEGLIAYIKDKWGDEKL
ncbi:unnamed protein product, partial [marine sediment metagenome]